MQLLLIVKCAFQLLQTLHTGHVNNLFVTTSDPDEQHVIDRFLRGLLSPGLLEPALAAISTNIVESAMAGSDEVGSAVVGLSAGTGSMRAGVFITNLIFGAGVPVGSAFGDFDAFLEGEGGQLAAFLLRTRGRGIVGWWWWHWWRWWCGQNFRGFF